MSVSYYLYTEGLIQGKWKCINSYLPMGDSYHLIETYYSVSTIYLNKLAEPAAVLTTPADFFRHSYSTQQRIGADFILVWPQGAIAFTVPAI